MLKLLLRWLCLYQRDALLSAPRLEWSEPALKYRRMFKKVVGIKYLQRYCHQSSRILALIEENLTNYKNRGQNIYKFDTITLLSDRFDGFSERCKGFCVPNFSSTQQCYPPPQRQHGYVIQIKGLYPSRHFIVIFCGKYSAIKSCLLDAVE